MGARVTTSVAALAVAITLGGCTPAPATMTPVAPSAADRVTDAPTAGERLFVARADGGSLTSDPGLLILDGVTTVSWFTDRPARSAGASTLTDALTALGWDEATGSLGTDPPNAALTADELGTASIAVELTAASLVGDSVTFTVTALDGSQLVTTSLTHVELFIDDVLDPQTTALAPGITATTSIDDGAITVTIEQNGTATQSTRVPRGQFSGALGGPGDPVQGTIMVSPGNPVGYLQVTGSLTITDGGQQSRYDGQLALWAIVLD